MFIEMEKMFMICDRIKQKEGMCPYNSTILSWVFISEKFMFPCTRRLVPECSVAWFAKVIISGIGKETVVS